MPASADEHKTWVAGVFDRAAATYDRIGTSYHDVLGRRLLDVAAPPAGFALLDVACGRGAVLAAARTAARRVGVDVSAEMIARTGAELTGVELRVMDAEFLDFDDQEFDLVTCAFAVFFLPRPDRAMAEFRRVLRPGGLVALSSWGEDDPRWAWEGDVLSGLRLHREELEIRFADARQWWDWSWSFSRRGMLEQVEPGAVEALRAASAQHLAAMQTPDGLPMRLVAWFAIGRAA
jgi:SAM-dependent methyltransferase